MTTKTRDITFMPGGRSRARSTRRLLAVAVCGVFVAVTGVPARAQTQICGSRGSPPCPAGEYCDLLQGTCGELDQGGVCEPIPRDCTLQYDPVCGCDGITYGNVCFAAAAGASIRYKTECRPVPAVSQWGLGALALLLLSGVALKFGRRRAVKM